MRHVFISILVHLCGFLCCINASAQQVVAPSPSEFKDIIDQYDGQMYYDDLGVQMYIGQDGDIRSNLSNSGSSDREVYDNLQLCQRMYKKFNCIPQYVVSYFLTHFKQYQSYYLNTLSKTGDINDAAAVFILLTSFNSKCKSCEKSYQKFAEVAENFDAESASKIVLDSSNGNSYRGATLMMLSIQLKELFKNGAISDISSKTKNNLIKAYESVLRDCEKVSKKNDSAYNESLNENSELYTLILNTLKQ